MVDVLTPEQRRLNMSRIRSRDTKPEMLIRKGLHALGFRYRLHDRKLPGRPDLVLTKYRVVVLVHGCFWHGHHCPRFRLPSTRQEFWAAKIASNQRRDALTHESLRAMGWRILTIWECSLKGPRRWTVEHLLEASTEFILSTEDTKEISGL